jgi:hypothetical protein
MRLLGRNIEKLECCRSVRRATELVKKKWKDLKSCIMGKAGCDHKPHLEVGTYRTNSC